MAQKDLEFSCLKESYGGKLSPKDLSLFYYDICFDKEDGFSLLYEWSDAVQSFLDINKITIEDRDIKTLPKTFDNNCIFFEMCSNDKENKAVAFFRHLRNAFSHYNIGDDGDFFLMKDFYFEKSKPTDQTMIGKISKKLFYELMNIFFKQKEKLHDNFDKEYYNPNI